MESTGIKTSDNSGGIMQAEHAYHSMVCFSWRCLDNIHFKVMILLRESELSLFLVKI